MRICLEPPAQKAPSAPVPPRQLLRCGVVACLLLLYCSFDWVTAQPRSTGSDSSYGVVDVRVLLACHPLMAKFDAHSRRFRETASSALGDPDETRQHLEKKRNALQSELAQLDDQLKRILASGGDRAQSEYHAFWQKRSQLKEEYDLLESAREAASLQGNYVNGLPPPDTLMPIFMRISHSIRSVLRNLQTRYRLVAILDASALQPETPPPGTLALPALPSNLHWNLWRGEPLGDGDIDAWMSGCRAHFAQLAPVRFARPDKAGARDLTLEALRELRATPAKPR